MKQKILVISGLIIAVGIAFFALKKEGSEVTVVSAQEEAKQTSQPKISKESNRETFVTKSHGSINLAPNNNALDTPSCRESWAELAKVDSNQWGKASGKGLQTNFVFGEEAELKNFKDNFNYSSRCQVAKQHPLKAVSDEVQSLCYNSGQAGSSSPSTLSCMHALLKLRFEAIDYLTKDQPIDQIKDVSILGAKIFAQVMKPGDTREPEKLVEISRRLLELEPENVMAAEYIVQGAYLKYMTGGNADNAKQFESASQELSEKFPNSPLAFESQMAVARQRKDFGLVRKLAEEGKEAGLDANTSNYHMAWASFLENRDEEAKNYLIEIVRQNPDDYKAKSSLERLSQKEPIPDEIRRFAAPFSDSLGSFQYGITMAPVVLVKPLTNVSEYVEKH